MSYQHTKLLVMFLSVFFSITNVSFAESGGGGSSPCDGLQLNLQSALIVLDSNPTNSVQPITVTRTGNGSCNFFIVLDNGTASTYSERKLNHGVADSIPIQLYKDPGHTIIIKSKTEATGSTDVLFGSFTGSSSQIVLNYYPVVNTSVSVPTGPYNDTFTFSPYTWDGNNLASKISVNGAKSVNISYRVNDSVEISLVNTGGLYNSLSTTQTMNFGTLQSSESLAIDVLLKYSSGYVLSMSSVNSNQIKNSTSANYVSYTMLLDGVQLSLTSAMQTVKTGTGSSISGGTRLPLVVTIGNITNVPAGTYNDTVSIRIASAN